MTDALKLVKANVMKTGDLTWVLVLKLTFISTSQNQMHSEHQTTHEGPSVPCRHEFGQHKPQSPPQQKSAPTQTNL